MKFKDLFKKVKTRLQQFSRWKEYGIYRAIFSSFGRNAYKSDLVRDAVRPLAEHTSKANARCTDPQLERLLNVRPNMYMSGKDFLAKIRIWLELKNTVFIFIHRNDRGRCDGLYPLPYEQFSALDYKGRLFIKFDFANKESMYIPWEDLAVLRKDYNESDISGDLNDALYPKLELVNTIDQGTANAIKATANLRGILKSTKAILAPEALNKMKEDFTRDYLSLENAGGIAAIDGSTEFIPIKMDPVIASWETKKEAREDVYRYFGVSDAIVMNNYTEQQMEAFYEGRIEPFLLALSLELTGKIFTDRERALGSQVVYEANRLQFASTQTKLAMVALVDRALMTPNEYRMIFGLSPYEGGDEFLQRLDTDKTGNMIGASTITSEPEETEGEEDGSEE